MIYWIAAALLVVGFVVLVRWFGLVERSQKVIAIARRSFGVIRSSSLSDEAKEALLQKDARRLFKLFFLLAVGGAAAAGLPAGLLWMCDQFGWISFASVMHVALSPMFLIVSGFVALAVLFGGTKKPGRPASDYSAVDRLLHRVAFRTTAAQTAVADLEDQLFAKRLAACKADRPVFITALPRAGTTLLLECLAELGPFASHCYRDMPFVLIPCMWNRFAARFCRDGRSRPRAHGDGMLINFDSPEAFEEVLWKTFWRDHYRADRIEPWHDDEENAEFDEFFRNHMRKIVWLRRGEAPGARYVSKNNLNVARIGLLKRLFPDSVVLVPFRDPLQHAASLLRQHRNFLRIHGEDPFASEYMRAIGHFDFGENLRPVDFDGWLDQRESTGPDSLAFWLEYWVAGYRHLLEENADSVHFIGYEALCEEAREGLHQVALAIDCHDEQTLMAIADTIHAPRPHDVDTSGVNSSLLQESRRLHERLQEVALVRSPEMQPVG